MKKSFVIEELDCAHCAAKIEEEIKKIEGVNNVSVNFLAQKMTIDAQDEKFDEILKSAVEICKRVEPDCNVIL